MKGTLDSHRGGRENPTYSICITHKNNIDSLEQSLGSILDQIDDSFEVLVVDSNSTDGSLKTLQELASHGRIRLIEQQCTRGRGRQIAMENAKGTYILSNFDMDDVFNPRISQILQIYHQSFEGMMVRIVSPKKIGRWEGHFANSISPAELIRNLGGWTDVQFGEDIDLWCRAALLGKYGWMEFDLIESTFAAPERRILERLRTKWNVNKDFRKLGLAINAGTIPSRLLKLATMIRYSKGKNWSTFKTDFSSFNSSYYHLSRRYYLGDGKTIIQPGSVGNV